MLLRIESKDLLPVEFSAISDRTISNFSPLIFFIKFSCINESVKSPFIISQFAMGSVDNKSKAKLNPMLFILLEY